VDVESNLYSLSFAANPNWKNTFAKQPELYAYLRGVADRFDLRRDVVFDCTVVRLDWDASAHHWRIQTSAGERTASHVVLATGAGSVWTAGGCQSWYLDEDGRNTNIWPGTTVDFRRRTLRFDPDAHVLHAHKVPEQAVV
jgi:glycine/D-amino acid oxidase-like deaminating enzyme